MPDTVEDMGYYVPAICQHPDCNASITRGRVNTCGADPAGVNGCCGMVFCGAHLQGPGQTCERCAAGEPPFEQKEEQPDMLDCMLTGVAWAQWRADNPDKVMELAGKKALQMQAAQAAIGTDSPEKESA